MLALTYLNTHRKNQCRVEENSRNTPMSGYHVSFYKNLLSSDGHPFRCLQEDLFVEHSLNPRQAAESACRQFERCHGLRDWKQLADSMEVESEARRVAQRR